MYMEKAIMSMLQLLTCVQFIGFLGISASVFGCSMSFWPCFICRRVHFLCLHLRRVPHRDRVCLHLTTLQTSILPSFLQLNATVTIAPNFSTFTLGRFFSLYLLKIRGGMVRGGRFSGKRNFRKRLFKLLEILYDFNPSKLTLSNRSKISIRSPESSDQEIHACETNPKRDTNKIHRECEWR
ncbi:hypothetical protein GmHk_01G001200 [Glycine max]|nr:hypothetical protein GmHk_01G001200 [Glycine max]